MLSMQNKAFISSPCAQLSHAKLHDMTNFQSNVFDEMSHYHIILKEVEYFR